MDFLPTYLQIPRQNIFRFTLICVVTILCSNVSAQESDYAYPIDDPIVSTVVGTPAKYQADIGDKKDFEKFKFKVFDDRVTPNYFWYNDKITYGLMQQKHKAPLVFIIAGTGGNYAGPKITFIARALFKAGFHVVSLPSPTHMSFIIAASNSSVPGLLDDDSHDLYNVMKLIWATNLKSRIEVSDFYVTGYSLGGAQTAYVAYIDEHQKFFNFKKALVMNTPVSLITSVQILDDYVDKSFSKDKLGQKFEEFWRETWALMSRKYSESSSDKLQISPDFLFDLYKEQDLDNKKFKALIATAFRISAASMIMTSDVMSQSGYIVPKGATLHISDDVRNYSAISHRTSFEEYAKRMMLPFFQNRDSNITFDVLVERASLYPLEEYLRTSEKVVLIHNEDDIIMAPGEIEWLEDVFEDRAKIYPTGGHLGNVAYKENIDYMLSIFKQ